MATWEQRKYQRPSALRLIPRINRLTLEVRQYFPKGADLSQHGTDELSAVTHALNTRPRKALGWRTPAEALDRLLKQDMIEGVATTG